MGTEGLRIGRSTNRWRTAASASVAAMLPAQSHTVACFLSFADQIKRRWESFFIAQMLPANARFVHLVRDGIDTAPLS